jgi:hypothetical protein
MTARPIGPGKRERIVAVNGDPLRGVKTLQAVPFVMRSGVVYKEETGTT